MNSWETIKAEMTKESSVGSTGYLADMNKAAILFISVKRFMKDEADAISSFNTDGDVTELIGHWLEAGVNIQFPIQVGPFGGDAMKFRKMYGKDLRVIGSFDKMALEKGHDAIEAEIQRLIPLMKEGGFIIMPDHLITPGVALDDYIWYLERIRELRF